MHKIYQIKLVETFAHLVLKIVANALVAHHRHVLPVHLDFIYMKILNVSQTVLHLLDFIIITKPQQFQVVQTILVRNVLHHAAIASTRLLIVQDAQIITF